MTSPDLSHILLSNIPPDPAETILIETRIVDLTNAIASLTEQLQQLESERRRHREALSAIRRIPAEILGRIFSLILQFPLGAEGRDQLVNLSMVCTSWRDAALLSHRLWSSVEIHPRELSSQSYEKIVRWLERSGELPRRLEIAEVWGEEYQGWCSGDSDDCHLLKPVVIQLLTNGPNISELAIESKGPECFTRLTSALNVARQDSERRSWDSIQMLDVLFAGDAGWTLETLVEDRHEVMFTSLPPVKSLSLWFPSADDAFSDPLHSGKVHFDILPRLLENLTRFTICCDWEGAHILSALQHCRNLEVLEVDLSFEDLHFRVSERGLEQRLSDDGVTFPRLRTLRLRHQDELGILRYLVTPALTTLDMGFDGQSEKEDVLGNGPRRLHHGAILRDFVHCRSHCQQTLTTLRIYDAAFSPAELIELLFDFPSLTHLILDHVYFNLHQFLTSLQSKTIQSRYNPTVRKCLPCLEVLELLRLSVHTPTAPPILAAMFGFLLDRGRPCRVTMSFANHRVLNEAWAMNVWTLLCEENEVAPGELGIFLKVVHPLKYDSDSY